MVESEGMALMPWGVLGRGMFRSPEEYKSEARPALGPQDENHRLLAAKLAELAKKKSTAATSIALAYVLHKVPYVFPVIGTRKPEQLKENIEALAVELSGEEIEEIEDTVPFDVGFPMNFLFETPKQKYRTGMGPSHIWQLTATTRIETVANAQVRASAPSYSACDISLTDLSANPSQAWSNALWQMKRSKSSFSKSCGPWQLTERRHR